MKHRFDSVLNAVAIHFPNVQGGAAWVAFQALVLAAVAVAGIAVGRWVVPAGDGVSSASLEVTESSSAITSESVAPDAPAEGIVIGVRFASPAPLGAGSAHTGWMTPDRILAETGDKELPGTLGATPDRILAETGAGRTP